MLMELALKVRSFVLLIEVLGITVYYLSHPANVKVALHLQNISLRMERYTVCPKIHCFL